jgi:hypothetical protein
MLKPSYRDTSGPNLEGVMSDSDFDFSEYFYGGDSFATSDTVQFEFVDYPALSGDSVEFSFRTVGGATAPPGAIAAQIVVMSHDHNILGGGTVTVRNGLGPHDTGANRIRPLQYTQNDGEYYLTITVGGDARHVSYRVSGGQISAA